jgi:ABC-type transport system involved in cytochrome c biogenesis permease subunit
VALGLILELVFRLGIGNLIASVAGYATLLIADGLSLGGDTFTVLQAVLDTQFWLATHVTTITLGYATTYLAGLLGIVYVVRGLLTPKLTLDEGRAINRMIYGTLCFSIFFSFVGTVLGGLWADDSWGRFWGWDPKENGALIIVLWNALVLHARWGGMVKERGMATLAIAGNIFVSWSWWGVNELGAGLHSYGFTAGTVLRLGLFVISQLLLIGIALIPQRYWWSIRRRTEAVEQLA